jgi:hypothetical protein
MIKILGVLKGINIKSKVTDDKSEIHNLQINIELIEGKADMLELVDNLKDIIELHVESKQPKLGFTPYKDDDKDKEDDAPGA